GIDPARPLDKQGDAFWWGGAGFSALAEPYGGFRMMVRGYDPGNGGAGVGTFKASIDGGAGRGGSLRAVAFDGEGRPVDAIEG
ncbi:MAG: hypothetical protein FJX47_00695, partial [Alphaproteobacteria bacterium]|nr:hypothetical protein [Alphaproteobacteria bacterium]